MIACDHLDVKTSILRFSHRVGHLWPDWIDDPNEGKKCEVLDQINERSRGTSSNLNPFALGENSMGNGQYAQTRTGEPRTVRCDCLHLVLTWRNSSGRVNHGANPIKQYVRCPFHAEPDCSRSLGVSRAVSGHHELQG